MIIFKVEELVFVGYFSVWGELGIGGDKVGKSFTQ